MSQIQRQTKTSARKHVAAVLSRVAAHSCCCPPLCRHTLTLVLRGEWPKLAPVAKTHLCVTLQRCASQLVQHPAAAPRCTALLALVNNPWTHPILDSILNGQPDSEHEEGKKRQSILVLLCELAKRSSCFFSLSLFFAMDDSRVALCKYI